MLSTRSDPAHALIWKFLDQRLTPDLGVSLSLAAHEPSIAQRVSQDAESFGVLPDPTYSKKLSWEQVRHRVVKCEAVLELVNEGLVRSLLSLRDKREFGDLSEKIWPPRSATDLALRRTRLLDWVIYFRSNGRLSDLEEVLFGCRLGWDLIFVTNLTISVAVYGIDWYRRWSWLGAFDCDLSHYNLVAKKVHDLGKSVGIQDENWTWFVECSTMGGYRNMPYPGFDVVAETKALANGGEPHCYYGYDWTNLCDEFLPMNFHPVVWTSFGDWVVKASWLTTGASSVGYLLVTGPDGKQMKIKARKNMVADVIDLGELAEDSVQFRGQTNSTIIKSELGKLRLAVAGDIYNYLKMTWITDLLGGAYYDWPGNTSEENMTQQTERMAKMLSLCAKRFGLPYDYAGFDHQPTLDELLGIIKRLTKHARLNVPTEGLAEFDDIVSSIVSGFHSATLRVRLDGHDQTFPVTGGLMSGLRWTSVVGNAWNSVMTGLALKLLTGWGMDISQIDRYIRGDDSAIFVDSWATGAAMNLAYDAIGAKAGVGKFSLQYHKMEFLRIWFEDRCYGYPSRAVPGLGQRKPWSSNPWSEDMVIKAVYETIRTLRRRVCGRDRELDDIWRCLRRVWCANHGLPDAVCWTPVHAGGLGIEAPRPGENWRIVPAVPRAVKDAGLVVDNQLPWRADRMRGYALEKYGLRLGEEADKIAQSELLSTMTTDNIPSIAKVVRKEWLDGVRRAGCRAFKTKTELAGVKCDVNINVYSPDRYSDLLTRLRNGSPLFGSCPEVETARADFNKFRPDMTFKNWVNKYFPGIGARLRQFHGSWHLSEKLDYLSGKLKLSPKSLHPALVGILARLVACCLKPKRQAVRCSSLWLGTILEPSLCMTPLSRHTYWW